MDRLPFLAALAHTPGWVYAVFAALLFLGWQQSRNRALSRWRLALLPALMLGLSLNGVASSFGWGVPQIACWAAGVTTASVLGGHRLKSSARTNPAGLIDVPAVGGLWS